MVGTGAVGVLLLPLPPLQPVKHKVPNKNGLSTVASFIAHVLSCLNRNAESFCANFMCSEAAVSVPCQAIGAFGNVVFCGRLRYRVPTSSSLFAPWP
jgi:hypothetical protein